MQVTPTELPDVKLIVPKKFADDRGFFVETFNQANLAAHGLVEKMLALPTGPGSQIPDRTGTEPTPPAG